MIVKGQQNLAWRRRQSHSFTMMNSVRRAFGKKLKKIWKSMNSKKHCVAFWNTAHGFLSQNPHVRRRPIAESMSIMLVQDCHQSPQHPRMPAAHRQPELRGSNELGSVARSNHIEVTFCLQKWMKTIFPEMMCDSCDFVLGSNISNSMQVEMQLSIT